MEKTYTGRYINLQALAQEINSILAGEGWESSTQMMSPPMGSMQDYIVRGLKKGHMHHAEELIIRITGAPNDFRIIIEEEHIGALGRELIDHRLFKQIDKEINDGLFDMPYTPTPSPQMTPTPQMPSMQPQMPQTTAQGLRCSQCGYQNPPGAKFCLNCGNKLM
ncbi:zinc ribbon domain-containing protein [Acidianus brierleyi]|uniref:Zinc ribbon domain-containing protein n=1 Tax=Acidianus brierleyi TaxID=41673 RepID=A0A2U9IC48_9CREN|nr:zinc ribbon domain-containing protein [Acidianus brierleyi]AWR93583.1 zinc-ribbon domain-containing protein [Acidianus brierleyi]